jgi:Bacterial pre-peptidase C-terminal domain/Matrixin
MTLTRLDQRASLVLIVLSAAITALVAAAPAYAGGPIAACKPGEPYRWPSGGVNIPWNPDQGSLGPLTNAEAVAQVELAFNAWKSDSSTVSFLQGAALPADVNITNFFPYFFPSAPDSLSAIVFDDNGEIFDLLFGPNSGILGFAGPEWVNDATCDVLEGVSFLNGAAFGDPQEALDVMVHEFGHYQGLGHSIVNGQIVIGDTTGPTPFDTFPVTTLVNLIETMYPFYFGPAAGFATPDKDDLAALATLYPAATFYSSTGTITGRILAANGRRPKPGFNVIARNLANPIGDAVSGLSGAFTTDLSPDSPLAGVYIINGLTPGARYAVYVDEILAGDFSLAPGSLAGPEEFYSGRLESKRRDKDDPSTFEPVKARAGVVADGIDIIFNGFTPGEPLPLRDETSIELSLPTPFRMCGTRYHEVYVNSNGTMTFGSPVIDFSESAAEFLAGPPQIAALWDDLDPGAGGEIYFTEERGDITVHFSAVPEFGGAAGPIGANTFAVTLKRLFDQITLSYGDLTAQDGLAGVSCGGAITSGFEPPVDLSRLADKFRISLLFQPAVFEQFFAPTPTSPGSPNDLANLTLRFTPTTDYSDFWAEPNNTLARARRIELPFNSTSITRFTEIGRVGDVDYFRFTAKAGDVITAEILSSQMDTVMALYDRATGELLASDDDGGPGLLSRIVFTVPADGEYAVAIAALSGQPTPETGRYVLSVAK